MEKISRNKAIEEGLETYFTGKECINGHVAPRYISNTNCLTCASERGARKWEELKTHRLSKIGQPRKFIEVGDKFGLLTVVNRNPEKRNPKDRHILWDCVCECGGHRTVKSNLLRSDRVTHCGCKAPHKRKGRETLYAHYDSYKHGARNRKLEFALTVDEFEETSAQNCHYCNEPPKDLYRRVNYKRKDGSSTSHYKPEKLNGIDRIDSAIGYNASNIVASCYPCNRMKSDLSTEDFMNHLRKILSHFQLKTLDKCG